MSFGLVSTPTTFQRLVILFFESQRYRNIFNSIDDFSIVTKNWQFMFLFFLFIFYFFLRKVLRGRGRLSSHLLRCVGVRVATQYPLRHSTPLANIPEQRIARVGRPTGVPFTSRPRVTPFQARRFFTFF